MKIVSVEFIEKNFKIEDDVYIFSGSLDEITKKFVDELIENKFDKSLEELNDEDIENVTDFLLTLGPSKTLYSLIGLLNFYNFNDTNMKSKNSEKILSNDKLKSYRDCLYAITLIDDNKTYKHQIEEFEKENNVSISIERF